MGILSDFLNPPSKSAARAKKASDYYNAKVEMEKEYIKRRASAAGSPSPYRSGGLTSGVDPYISSAPGTAPIYTPGGWGPGKFDMEGSGMDIVTVTYTYDTILKELIEEMNKSFEDQMLLGEKVELVLIDNPFDVLIVARTLTAEVPIVKVDLVVDSVQKEDAFKLLLSRFVVQGTLEIIRVRFNITAHGL